MMTIGITGRDILHVAVVGTILGAVTALCSWLIPLEHGRSVPLLRALMAGGVVAGSLPALLTAVSITRIDLFDGTIGQRLGPLVGHAETGEGAGQDLLARPVLRSGPCIP